MAYERFVHRYRKKLLFSVLEREKSLASPRQNFDTISFHAAGLLRYYIAVNCFEGLLWLQFNLTLLVRTSTTMNVPIHALQVYH